MSRFIEFFEKSVLKKNVKYGRSMGSDAIALDFLKELDATDCSMRVWERLRVLTCQRVLLAHVL